MRVGCLNYVQFCLPICRRTVPHCGATLEAERCVRCTVPVVRTCADSQEEIVCRRPQGNVFWQVGGGQRPPCSWVLLLPLASLPCRRASHKVLSEDIEVWRVVFATNHVETVTHGPGVSRSPRCTLAVHSRCRHFAVWGTQGWLGTVVCRQGQPAGSPQFKNRVSGTSFLSHLIIVTPIISPKRPPWVQNSYTSQTRGCAALNRFTYLASVGIHKHTKLHFQPRHVEDHTVYHIAYCAAYDDAITLCNVFSTGFHVHKFPKGNHQICCSCISLLSISEFCIFWVVPGDEGGLVSEFPKEVYGPNISLKCNFYPEENFANVRAPARACVVAWVRACRGRCVGYDGICQRPSPPRCPRSIRHALSSRMSSVLFRTCFCRIAAWRPGRLRASDVKWRCSVLRVPFRLSCAQVWTR